MALNPYHTVSCTCPHCRAYRHMAHYMARQWNLMDSAHPHFFYADGFIRDAADDWAKVLSGVQR